MKFSSNECKAIKMEQSERRPNNDCYFKEDKLWEATCGKGVHAVPSLSPEHHIRKIVKELIYSVINMKIVL